MKSYFRISLVCSMSVVAVGMTTNISLAQTQARPASQANQVQPVHKGHNHEGDAHDHDHGKETIAFQLPQWKTMHFDDAAKASQHTATLKQMGCEVSQDNHARHIDVRYRCVEWRSLEVKDHQLAAQWEGWLKASGFDVSHGHTAPVVAAGPEAVEFRMTEWKQLHGTGSQREAQLINQLKAMGCEVQISQHGGHADIAYRAPTWRDIHLPDHASAEQWMGWLKQNGFEVKHQH
jgi:hypothetical protein